MTQDSPHFQELHVLRSLTRTLLTEVQVAFHREITSRNTGTSHTTTSSNSIERSSSSSSKEREQKEQLLLRDLQAELKEINAEMSSCFNPQFGGIFRTDTHPSLFSVAVRKYADIYMKDLSSLNNYSPNHKFYPTQSIHMVSS